MLIVCPSCATSYQVEPSSLGQGRSVRCARCRNVWFATVPGLAPAMAGSDQWDDVVDNGAPVPAIDGAPPVAAASASDRTAAFAAPPDIDVGGLSAEMASDRAPPQTAADAALMEIATQAALTESPPLAPAQPSVLESIPAGAGESGAIEAFAARRARRNAARRSSWQTAGIPAAIFVLIVINMSLLAARADIVRILPQTASLYAAIGLPVNLRGMIFEDVRMSRTEQNGTRVLVVEGSIVNVTGRPIEIPRLRLALINDAKQEIYAWTAQPVRSILAPGDALPFRSRLAAPPPEAREVQVRFFSKRDILSGTN